MPPQPRTRRHLVAQIRRRLDAEIAPIVAVRGPRQVGKTTAQFQIIVDLLEEGILPTSILWVPFDELKSWDGISSLIFRICDWFEVEVAKNRFNMLARDGRKAHLFFDEIQNLENWSAELKSLVDNASVKVVVTGSSACGLKWGASARSRRVCFH